MSDSDCNDGAMSNSESDQLPHVRHEEGTLRHERGGITTIGNTSPHGNGHDVRNRLAVAVTAPIIEVTMAWMQPA